ncbi:hypothetical protein ACR4XJ_09200 [Nitratidesulfovibrio sp. D1]|uniref:hypothetical protein n=1 Tax=Nitratidesulfovibrio sp. D1 TaxID=3440151 RepID=UPI003EBF6091
MMRKHQFAKVDCNCTRRATHLKCIHCGVMEYRSLDEARRMSQGQAECPHPDAPQVPPQERFRTMMGGTLDCLAPDYDTHFKAD